MTVAAISLLDERYESLPTPDDDNTYVFGRFAQHPVVITYPPSGGYGATSTAIVASRLLQTFRNIRFGLLVGIGSGAPSRDHDIRLGDVVVGRPDRGHGGIVQYGFGKTFPSDRFVQKSAHSGPPTLLLNVLAQLQAQHMIYKPMYVDYLSALAANDGQLDYPGTRYDNLYQSACVHSVESDDCSHCDPTATVARPERSSTAPQVHYGSIASGNQVIKDGSARDKLSRELGVLCFEMEAAGLMEDFPCLVIKGIADYADSHKNKRWQRYAATTAATYAKELLYCVHTDSLGTGDGVDADNASTSSGTLLQGLLLLSYLTKSSKHSALHASRA
ncbi:purine and uridine phosphorylase [Aspergillus crustosus]